MLKLDVYKGFNDEFYNSISTSPLIDIEVGDKLDVRKFDKNFSNILQIAIIQGEGEHWITYEEYSFVKTFIEQRCLDGELEVRIIRNNIYPEIYPISYNISDDIIGEILDNMENRPTESLSSQADKLSKIYSNILNIDGKNYVTYYNDEVGNEAINKIEDYYNQKIEIGLMREDSDFIIDITNELSDFIKNINEIQNHGFKKVGLEMSCDTLTSRMIRNSYATYFAVKNIDICLFDYSEKIKEKEQILNRFSEIAKDVIKIPNFKDFRKIKFYENIDYSRDTIEISQQTIMYDLVNESQKANNGEIYRDIFVTAPTGSGKSVMFQIPAIYLAEKYNKMTIVIEPIKSLMEDQKNKLSSLGYNHAEFLNSDIATAVEKEKIIERIKTGDVHILYLSPETLLSYSIESIIGDRDIGLIVIDEAHIVTTWGVGFRPDYWYLGSYINRLRNKPKYWKSKNDVKEYKFPICTFTATAICGGKDDTFKEASLSLYLKAPIKYIGNLRRDNIKFDICNYPGLLGTSDYETKKIEKLGQRIYEWTENKNKTIIYFPYHRLAQDLYDGLGIFRELSVFKDSFGLYTGQADKETKFDSIRDFEENKKCIMLATKAFGMGIDISDIQNVYHYAISGNLSDYVQEIGRVARNENVTGYAITDYFDNDKMYMNRLFGMSQIRHFQINKVLQIIYDVYKNKKNRNFLVTPRMFFGIFGNDEDRATNRIKIVLLMLEKDLYEKFSFKVLISRPRSIFTNAFVVIDRTNESLVLNSKYGKYFKFSANGKYKYPNPDGSFTTDFGDIYTIDLKSLWEDYYANMTFASFKFDFFSKFGDTCSEIRAFIRGRVKVTLNTKNNVPFRDLKDKMYGDINFIIDKLREFGRNYFTVDDFGKKLEERFGKGLKQKLIANSFLELVDENKETYKTRTLSDGRMEYVIANSSIETKIYYLIKGGSLLRELSSSKATQHVCYLPVDKNEGNLKAFRLLSLLDLITYEVLGGDNPEIFIRLNDPEKIRKIVSKQVYYNNDYVDKAQEKHYRSVRIMDYFFRNIDNDEDRWDFIEDYFAGEDVVKLTNNVIPDEINYKELEKCLVKDKSYSLKECKNWNDCETFIYDKYVPVFKKMSKLNIRIPDYASALIKVEEYKINALIVWVKENIIILDEETDGIILEICKRIGWKAYKMSDIDYDYLKKKLIIQDTITI